MLNNRLNRCLTTGLTDVRPLRVSKYYTFGNLKLNEVTELKAPKMVKKPVFELLDWAKLISRKIQKLPHCASD